MKKVKQTNNKLTQQQQLFGRNETRNNKKNRWQRTESQAHNYDSV